MFWFDDANGKRIFIAGTFVYEPTELVEVPSDTPVTHRVTLYEKGEPIRMFKVDIAKTTCANGEIWWQHPVTNKQIIVSGTFTCTPLDIEPERLGHYKPAHQISLFQAGRELGQWAIRTFDTNSDQGTIWFTDDFSRLVVIISGEFTFEPKAEPKPDNSRESST
jgi:hypothetical protein